jgi:hypothetical protein
MRNTFETIARENFRSSGYIQHPRSERRTAWQFTAPPRSPFHQADTVRSALQRRESALLRNQPKTSLIQNCINVLFNR